MDYDLIYEAALSARSKEDLQRKLTKLNITNVDAVKPQKNNQPFNEKPFTVASRLAYEGDSKRVGWLRELGADPDAIIVGYVLGGNRAKAVPCQAWYKPVDYGDGWKQSGYCFPQAHADALLGDMEHLKHSSHIVDPENPAIKKMHTTIMRAFAIRGDFEEATKYSKNEIEPKYSPDNTLHLMAEAAAQGGHHKEVEEYLNNQKVPIEVILRGYAAGGYYDKIEEYRKDSKFKLTNADIITAFKAANNVNPIKEYDLKVFLNDYLVKRENIRDSENKPKEYFYGSLFKGFQKSYSEKKLAVDKLKTALDGGNVDLSQDDIATLENGSLGKGLKQFIKTGKADELVGGKEVRTISEFIKELKTQKELVHQGPQNN
jgi:hypothetical protein